MPTGFVRVLEAAAPSGVPDNAPTCHGEDKLPQSHGFQQPDLR